MTTDDYRADRGTVGFLDVGGVLPIAVESDTDRDWVRVSLRAGEHYAVRDYRDDYLPGGSPVTIRDAAGNLVAGVDYRPQEYGGGYGFFTANRTGDYFIEVGGEGVRSSLLTVERMTDDIGQANATAARLGFVDTITSTNFYAGGYGNLDYPGDVDRFAVTVKAGLTYDFKLLTGRYDSSDYGINPENARLELRAVNNAVIAGGDAPPDGYAELDIRHDSYADATLYLTVGSDTNSVGDYTLQARALLPDRDIAGDFGRAFDLGTITSDLIIGGTSEIGDRDVVKFRVAEAGFHGIGLSAQGEASLNVFAANALGTAVKPVSDIAYGEDLYNLKAGVYFARIANPNADYETRYDLSFDRPEPDAGNTFAAARDLGKLGPYGYVTTDEVNAVRDDDMYRFTLDEAARVTVNLTGGAANTSLYLYNRPVWNTAIASSEKRADDVITRDLGPGTYYVGVHSPNGTPAAYDLSVSRDAPQPPDDDFTASVDAAGRLIPGGSVAGVIQAGGDEDWFGVYLEKGRTYTFDAEGASTKKGTLVDPELVLRDGEGGWLAFADAGGSGTNAKLTFKAEASGTHLLSVADHGHADAGTYRVGVTAQAAPTPPPPPPAAPVGTPRNDVLVGTAGAELVRLGDGDDRINARAGNDELYGDNGNDLLFGEDGDDVLWGGAGRDTLDGGTGNDFLAPGPDVDRLTGGGGNDTIRLDARHVLSGADVLTDFARGDRITITGVFSGGGTVRAAAGGNGADLLVDLDGGGSAHGARAIVHLDYASAASLIVTDDQQGNAVVTLR